MSRNPRQDLARKRRLRRRNEAWEVRRSERTLFERAARHSDRIFFW